MNSIVAYKYFKVGSGIAFVFESFKELENDIFLGVANRDGKCFLEVGENSVEINDSIIDVLHEAEELHIAVSEKEEYSIQFVCNIPLERLFVGKVVAYYEINQSGVY